MISEFDHVESVAKQWRRFGVVSTAERSDRNRSEFPPKWRRGNSRNEVGNCRRLLWSWPNGTWRRVQSVGKNQKTSKRKREILENFPELIVWKVALSTKQGCQFSENLNFCNSRYPFPKCKRYFRSLTKWETCCQVHYFIRENIRHAAFFFLFFINRETSCASSLSYQAVSVPIFEMNIKTVKDM